MEADVPGMALSALQIMADPMRIGFLVLGVLIGLFIGVIPGLGGVIGLSLLMPFTFGMDTYSALALLMGMLAVAATSDTIPSVLFGVPGTVGSQATILDGHPMARRGEAGRAFAAAFTASMIGGLFGAFLLALSIPLIRPLVLAVGSPELFAITVFGISLVAVLSGSAPIKGMVAACIGLMLAAVGADPQTGTMRFTFGTLYLWDGLSIVPVALGLFAIPELADMAISRRRIAEGGMVDSRRGRMQGIRDVLTRPFLVLRCSAIGALVGAIPGVGASVIDWIAYGHAARTERDASKTFGKGDVRGLIAPESANNAKEAGTLVPTIAFGVPGSAPMALLLGTFMIHGIVPGPEMLSTRLDVTYTLVWSVALANVLGAGLCFLLANQLAKVAVVRPGLLVPIVLSVTYIGAFQGSNHWGDLYVLLGMGLLGWIMKRLKWPRPPLILGFVLGPLLERYLFISVSRYGLDWLSRPIVLILLAMTLYGLLAPFIRNWFFGRKVEAAPRLIKFSKDTLDSDLGFAALVLVALGSALYIVSGWAFTARLVPMVVTIAAILFLLVQIWLMLLTPLRNAVEVEQASARSRGVHMDVSTEFTGMPRSLIAVRAVRYFTWLLLFLGASHVLGLLVGLAVFLVAYMRLEARERWLTAIGVAAACWVFSYVVFDRLLMVPWPQTLLGEWFPNVPLLRRLGIV